MLKEQQARKRTKTKKLSRYAPTYDYTTFEGWSMGKEEIQKLLDEYCKYSLQGDKEKAREVSKKLPMAPNIALEARDRMGKRAFLAEGYNLADAEIAYGKNWVDEYNVINDNKGDGDE